MVKEVFVLMEILNNLTYSELKRATEKSQNVDLQQALDLLNTLNHMNGEDE